jgi:hypothetical protein
MILKYFGAWFGMMVLAIINGGFRDLAYKSRVGDLAAHQLSTACLIVLFAAFFWVLIRVWPIESASQAWVIGGMWFLMTVSFEFGMGRFMAGNSWSELLHAYNILEGQVWVLIPLWVLAGPYFFFRFVQGKQDCLTRRCS